ncbi:MAG: class I SAM-dependent rRNA methyltransferase [Planctomycetota bacterium]|jgi:23S rRNA (cytosine1962-C5)-methyltransferase|nr:class I SAM-dependent rRNA methyltransferase [Planctomycetota bacterium]
MLLPVVKLKTPRNSRHPWIFKKMVQAPRGLQLETGSLVEVRDKAGGFVGRAFYHPENTIALRLLTENREEEIDAAFFAARLDYARNLRETALDTRAIGDSCRVVHAEADLLPGLVIDKFADVLLIEPYVAGWLHVMDMVVDGLLRIYPGCRPAVRADANAAKKEDVSFGILEKRHPAPDHVDIKENGIRYRVNFRTGHKTGFFLDQRDNRARVAGLAKGRRVLDLCCYSGGFALSAWKGGAAGVEAVDLDEEALAAAAINSDLNGAGKAIRFLHRDVFDELRDRGAAGRRHDLVILDPPKLAAGQDDVEKALKTYYDMNRAAVNVVEKGGFFVTCSCSGAVSEERWRQTVRKAAADAGVGLTIFAATGPGADHPVAGDFPQGRYLKALFARVD